MILQAPEVFCPAQKSATYNHKADYWSFGTLVFECITGRRPFFHSNDTSRWYMMSRELVWDQTSKTLLCICHSVVLQTFAFDENFKCAINWVYMVILNMW